MTKQPPDTSKANEEEPGEKLGSTSTGPQEGSTSPQISENSDAPSVDSTKQSRFATPSSAKELAAQVNEVATKILNWEIDMETAGRYNAAVRTVSSLLSSEVRRAQAAKEIPDLSLGDDAKT